MPDQDLRLQQEISSSDLAGRESFIGAGVGNNNNWQKVFIHKLIALAREDAVVTAEQVKDLLETLSGDDRLLVSAIKDAVSEQELAELEKKLADTAIESIGNIEVRPERIDQASDLDGTYQCILSLTDQEIGRLRAAGVNFLEIWFGDEAIHEVNPWSPAVSTRIDAVIDVTEETQIGNIGETLAVRAVYRINQGGGQAFFAECISSLRVGGSPDADSVQRYAEENRNELMSEADTRRTDIARLSKLITAASKQALGRIETFPDRIERVSDLDGTYQSFVKLTDQEAAVLTAAGVNYLEIWFQDEAIHVVDPWVPALVTRVDAVIDAREETQIAARGSFVPVRAIYRINQGGGQNYFAEAIGALRIGPQAPDEDSAKNRRESPATSLLPLEFGPLKYIAYNAANYNSNTISDGEVMITPQLGSGRFGALFGRDAAEFIDFNYIVESARLKLRIPLSFRENNSLAATGRVETAEITGSHLKVELSSFNIVRAITVNDNVTMVVGNTTVERLAKLEKGTGGELSLSTTQQIALLNFNPSNGSITYQSFDELATELRSINIGISNPELITDDAWVEGEIQGQAALARTKVTSATSVLRLQVSQNAADAIAQNLADSSIDVELTFYDAANAGNVIEIINISIPAIRQNPSPNVQKPAYAANLSIDANDGSVFEPGTLTGNVNFNITNGADGDALTVTFRQDATGGRILTLNNAIMHVTGVPSPVLSTGANAVDILYFLKIGSAWYYTGISNNTGSTSGGSGEAESNKSIGGALNLPSGTSWGQYDITEDLEPDRQYSFLNRIGATNRFMRTSPFLGSDILNLAETAGTSFAQGSTANIFSVSSPRPDVDGVRTFFLAKTSNPRQILARCQDDHNIVNLIKLGGIKGEKGDKGDAGSGATDQTARNAAAAADAKAVAAQNTANTARTAAASADGKAVAAQTAAATADAKAVTAQNTANTVRGEAAIAQRTATSADTRSSSNLTKINALEERSPTALTALTYAASLEIDFDDGAMRSVTLTGNTTITFANFNIGDVLILQITQDSTGSRTITWPSSVEWADGEALLSDGSGDVDIITLLRLSSSRIIANAILDVS